MVIFTGIDRNVDVQTRRKEGFYIASIVYFVKKVAGACNVFDEKCVCIDRNVI